VSSNVRGGSTDVTLPNIATDDVGGVQYQVVKLDLGTAGATTPVTGSVPVSGTVTANAGTNLNTSALALDATVTANGVLIGAVNETAPATDTASSGTNGRLQRIAQRLTSLIALLPTSLGAGGGLKVDGSGTALPVSGTVTATVGTVTAVTSITNAVTVAQSTATSLKSQAETYQGGVAVGTANPLYVTAYDTDLDLSAGMSALRDVLVAERYTVLSDSVADGMAAFWTTRIDNGGAITVSVGEGLLQTSTGATGAAQMVSTQVIYYPGQVSWFNSAIRLNDTGAAGNVRRWGVFTVLGNTPNDGYYYELSGTTLNAVSCKAGTPTAVASTSWTKVATNPFTLDTNYHQFEIRYTANSVNFLIDNVLRHSASGGSSSITQTLNFPMAIQTINTSAASERTIAVRNVGIGRFGRPATFPAPAALSDVNANPTTTMAGNATLVYDPSSQTWARWQGAVQMNELIAQQKLSNQLLLEILQATGQTAVALGRTPVAPDFVN